MRDEPPCTLTDHHARIAVLESRADHAEKAVSAALAAQRWLWGAILGGITTALLVLQFVRH